MAWHLDGKSLASGSYDKTLRLWDASSGKLLRKWEGHQHWVTSLAFSPDGKSLASGSGDNTVRLWDASSGKEIARCVAGKFSRGIISGNIIASWYSLDFRTDDRGLWQGEGPILDELLYRDMGETPQPWPWLPRDWRAKHVPELCSI